MRKPHQVEFLLRRRFEELPENISSAIKQAQSEFGDGNLIRRETVRRVAELLKDDDDLPIFSANEDDDNDLIEIIAEIENEEKEFDLSEFDCELRAFRRELRVVEHYMSYLRTLEVDDFLARYRSEFSAHLKSENESAQTRDRFAFFHEPKADADFSLWLRASSWKIEQSVALSLGKDPVIVSSVALERYDDPVSPFREEFKKRLWLATVASESGELPKDRASPRDFTLWAASKSLDLPPELRSLISDETLPSDRSALTPSCPQRDPQRLSIEVDELRSALAQAQENLQNAEAALDLRIQKISVLEARIADLTFMDEIAPKSKTSIYRILVGIAASCFGYGGPQRSGASKRIETLLNDLATHYCPDNDDKFASDNPNDVRVKEDTILLWLDQAKQHTGFKLERPIPPIKRTSLPPTDS